VSSDPLELDNLIGSKEYESLADQFMKEMNARWDFDAFTQDVLQSQHCRQIVDRANRKGRFTSWDYQPSVDAKERYMRNHLDLNVLEADNRYPKPGT